VRDCHGVLFRQAIEPAIQRLGLRQQIGETLPRHARRLVLRRPTGRQVAFVPGLLPRHRHVSRQEYRLRRHNLGDRVLLGRTVEILEPSRDELLAG